MKSKVTELTLQCTKSKYSKLELWAFKNNVEIDVSGLLHMQQENLDCMLSKEDAIALADAIYNHFGLINNND
jgi:hypothetical protein